MNREDQADPRNPSRLILADPLVPDGAGGYRRRVEMTDEEIKQAEAWWRRRLGIVESAP